MLTASMCPHRPPRRTHPNLTRCRSREPLLHDLLDICCEMEQKMTRWKGLSCLSLLFQPCHHLQTVLSSLKPVESQGTEERIKHLELYLLISTYWLNPSVPLEPQMQPLWASVPKAAISDNVTNGCSGDFGRLNL